MQDLTSLPGGEHKPKPRLLRAGPLEMSFEAGSLRWIKLTETELLRGIVGTVRDASWRNVMPTLRDVAIRKNEDSFRVSFAAVHRAGDVHFEWAGTIVGSPTGRVQFDFTGTAMSTFARNRIGICVLHPIDLAGAPLVADTTGGIIEGRFPVDIARSAPFTDVVGYRWEAAPGIRVAMTFSGERFEMEDQRNWTDASYKTYCTPLRLPFPVVVSVGAQVRQSVVLELERSGDRYHAPGRTASRLNAADEVTVGSEVLGIPPRLGLMLGPGREEVDEEHIQALRRLRLDHMRVVVELATPNWRDTLEAAAKVAGRVGCDLELEVVSGDQGDGLEALVRHLGRVTPQIARLFVFAESSTVTTTEVITDARRAMSRSGIGIPLAGGSRANFAELNMGAVPIDELDVIGFPMNAQVHAYDDRSIMESIATHALVATSALRRSSDKPVAIGPISLRPRLEESARPRLEYKSLIEAYDARESATFGAAWLVGSLSALLKQVQITSLTYFTATGPAGIVRDPHRKGMEREDATQPDALLTPAYRVFEALAELDQPEALAVSQPVDVACVALRHKNGTRLLVANLGPTEKNVRLHLPGSRSIVTSRLLQATPSGWIAASETGIRTVHGDPDGARAEVPLAPCDVASIDDNL